MKLKEIYDNINKYFKSDDYWYFEKLNRGNSVIEIQYYKNPLIEYDFEKDQAILKDENENECASGFLNEYSKVEIKKDGNEYFLLCYCCIPIEIKSIDNYYNLEIFKFEMDELTIKKLIMEIII